MIRDYQQKIGKEIRLLANKCINLLNKYVIPVTKDEESLVFYYKMIADSWRFIAEVAVYEERVEAVKNAKKVYQKAISISQKSLNSTN